MLTVLHRLPIVCPLVAVCLIAGAVRGQNAVPPRQVKVFPVFVVPKGERAPTDDQTKRLKRHIDWCRNRYRELLRNKSTFAVAEQLLVYQSSRPLRFYRDRPEFAVPQVVSELLTALSYSRHNCPFVMVVVMMNSEDNFPLGVGGPLNGGFNSGGGILLLSSFGLDRSPNFQSTVQHELGHSFGLPHVDVYGYDMKTSSSIMSYNLNHHTSGFTASKTPGSWIPEDVRGLALNTRVFPTLRFDPKKDVPSGYAMAARVVTFVPLEIPGHPYGLRVTTQSGEEFGSKVANILQGRLEPSEKVGKVTFDARAMWHSAKSETGWVSVQVTFPYEVELTRVTVHSQHSGEYHVARAARVAVRGSEGQFRQVTEAELKSADDTVTFSKTKGRVWRLEFRAGESNYVVLRKLRFFSGDDELFPPFVYRP